MALDESLTHKNHTRDTTNPSVYHFAVLRLTQGCVELHNATVMETLSVLLLASSSLGIAQENESREILHQNTPMMQLDATPTLFSS